MPGLRSRDGVWYADCYFTDEHGVSHRRERSTRIRDDGTAQSKRTAEVAGRALEASLQAGKGRRARATTLRSAYAARQEALSLAGRSAASLDIAAQKSVHVLRYFGEDRDVSTLTEQELTAYAAYARRTRAVSTVEREFIELGAGCKAVGVRLPPRPALGKKRIVERWLNEAQTKTLLAYMRAQRCSKIDHFLMYRYLGLTHSELYRISRAGIDWRRNEVRVRGTKRDTRDRVLPMPPVVRAVLELRFGRGGRGFEVWSRSHGNRDLTNWARASGVIGIDERLSHNDLRRSFATELVAKGVPTKHVAELMGHVDEAMVNRIYARVATGSHMHDAIAHLHDPSD